MANRPIEASRRHHKSIACSLNFDDRYFDDPHQGLPTQGYATWINNMIKNEKINLVTSVDFFDLKHQIQPHQQIIYSWPIDRYFNYSQGFLGWRTLDFETQSLNINDFQGGSIVNYADAEIPLPEFMNTNIFIRSANTNLTRRLSLMSIHALQQKMKNLTIQLTPNPTERY